MAYTLVSCDDVPDLMNELETFAEAQGWTVDWNTGSQFGIHKDTCFVAFGIDGDTNPAPVTDTYPDPDVNLFDFRMYGAMSKSFTGGVLHYWGHPGSLVTSVNDNDRLSMNDLLGPFPEVHFFGDAEKIFVMIRTAEERYTHFGFGFLDRKGMTTPKVSYFLSLRHEWWNNSITSPGGVNVNTKAAMNVVGNNFWFDTVRNNIQFFIPDGVLDPAFGIADDVVMLATSEFFMTAMLAFGGSDLMSGSSAGILDHWRWSKNKPTTGGVPLLSYPIFLGGTAADSLRTFCGELPDIRLCDVSTLSIGEEVAYGSDVFLPFPFKRRNAGSYDGGPSTYGYGIAIKKVV